MYHPAGFGEAGERSYPGRGNPHAWLKSGAIQPAKWYPFPRAEIFAPPSPGSPFRPFAVSQLAGCSLSGAMGCNFCSVAAGTHAAPSAPVILRGIIEKQIATFIRALSNQRWVRIAKEIRRRFGERG